MHIPTGKKYYGCKVGNSKGNIANPSTFWVTYFTSSKLVHKLISEYGVDSFYFEIRKIFNNSRAALEWEAKVLRRLNASSKNEWLNQHNGGHGFHLVGPRTDSHIDNLKKNHVSWNRGKSHSDKTRIKMSSTHKSRSSIDNIRNNYKPNHLWQIISPNGSEETVASLQLYALNKQGWTRSGMYGAAKNNRIYRGHVIKKIPWSYGDSNSKP